MKVRGRNPTYITANAWRKGGKKGKNESEETGGKKNHKLFTPQATKPVRGAKGREEGGHVKT